MEMRGKIGVRSSNQSDKGKRQTFLLMTWKSHDARQIVMGFGLLFFREVANHTTTTLSHLGENEKQKRGGVVL